MELRKPEEQEKELIKIVLDEFSTKEVISGSGGLEHYKTWEEFKGSNDSFHLYDYDLERLAREGINKGFNAGESYGCYLLDRALFEGVQNAAKKRAEELKLPDLNMPVIKRLEIYAKKEIIEKLEKFRIKQGKYGRLAIPKGSIYISPDDFEKLKKEAQL